MVDVVDKGKCCGCGNCAYVCSRNAIKFKTDIEGFNYPVVDKDLCVKCGRCDIFCPIQNFQETENLPICGYIVQHLDDDIRRESTSGGGFTAIASYIIECGGIVIGAGFNANGNVVHQIVDNIQDLGRFRNSKYVQSDMVGIQHLIQLHLNSGRMVCFSGTPCQVDAIKKVFKNFEKLILVDVMCRGVASPAILEKYLHMQEETNKSQIKGVWFRDKYYGYHYSVMKIDFANGKKYHKGMKIDPYLRAFFEDNFYRRSCYSCKYRNTNRVSDITIWDAWKIKNSTSLKDDDMGATKILINTVKGKEIFERCKIHLRTESYTAEELYNKKDNFNITFNEKRRNAFFKDFELLKADELFEKYFPITIFMIAKGCLKTFLYQRKWLAPLFWKR